MNYTPNDPYALLQLFPNAHNDQAKLIILQIYSQYLKFIKNMKTYQIRVE